MPVLPDHAKQRVGYADDPVLAAANSQVVTAGVVALCAGELCLMVNSTFGLSTVRLRLAALGVPSNRHEEPRHAICAFHSVSAWPATLLRWGSQDRLPPGRYPMLFDKLSSRSLQLANRMVMAPMTRSRAPPLNAPDPATFYVPGAKGYTDYPALAA